MAIDISRRDWWAGILVLTAALLFHAVFPRYTVTVRPDGVFRTDRWRGSVEGAKSLREAPWASVAH